MQLLMHLLFPPVLNLQFEGPEELWHYRSGYLPEALLEQIETKHIVHYKLEDIPVETRRLLDNYHPKLDPVSPQLCFLLCFFLE